MSALILRLFLVASLATIPGLSLAAGDETDGKTEEKAEATSQEKAEKETAPDAEDDEKLNAEQKALAEQDEEWAEKLRQRHHEGDIALGVCGARLTALMWFYQSSVADGRDDLQPAYEALKESRTVLKEEAERRAVADGVGTSVSVMNEYSAELWDELVEASEEPENFQEKHDELFANVQECLTLFFRRGTKSVKTAPKPEAEEADADTDEADAEEDAGKTEEKAD